MRRRELDWQQGHAVDDHHCRRGTSEGTAKRHELRKLRAAYHPSGLPVWPGSTSRPSKESRDESRDEPRAETLPAGPPSPRLRLREGLLQGELRLLQKHRTEKSIESIWGLEVLCFFLETFSWLSEERGGEGERDGGDRKRDKEKGKKTSKQASKQARKNARKKLRTKERKHERKNSRQKELQQPKQGTSMEERLEQGGGRPERQRRQRERKNKQARKQECEEKRKDEHPPRLAIPVHHISHTRPLIWRFHLVIPLHHIPSTCPLILRFRFIIYLNHTPPCGDAGPSHSIKLFWNGTPQGIVLCQGSRKGTVLFSRKLWGACDRDAGSQHIRLTAPSFGESGASYILNMPSHLAIPLHHTH